MSKSFNDFAKDVMQQYKIVESPNSAEEFAYSLRNTTAKVVLKILEQYHKEFIEKN